eukprot:tig00020902_g15039.t1
MDPSAIHEIVRENGALAAAEAPSLGLRAQLLPIRMKSLSPSPLSDTGTMASADVDPHAHAQRAAAAISVAVPSPRRELAVNAETLRRALSAGGAPRRPARRLSDDDRECDMEASSSPPRLEATSPSSEECEPYASPGCSTHGRSPSPSCDPRPAAGPVAATQDSPKDVDLPALYSSLVDMIWRAVAASRPGSGAGPSGLAMGSRGVKRIVGAALADRAGGPNASFNTPAAGTIGFPQYEVFHHLLHRAVSDADVWSLHDAGALAKANWLLDSRGSGAMTRAVCEASMVALGRGWAASAARSPPLALSLRCIAAGAGLPDDLPALFLFCLVQTITTATPPWPAAALGGAALGLGLAHIQANDAGAPIRLRPVFEVPVSACTPRAAAKLVAAWQLPAAVRVGYPKHPRSRSRSRPVSSDGESDHDCAGDHETHAAAPPSGSGSVSPFHYGVCGLQRAALENRLRGLLRRPAADPRPPRSLPANLKLYAPMATGSGSRHERLVSSTAPRRASAEAPADLARPPKPDHEAPEPGADLVKGKTA